MLHGFFVGERTINTPDISKSGLVLVCGSCTQCRRVTGVRYGVHCIAGNQFWLLVVFPRPKIIVVKYYIPNSPVKYDISSSVLGRLDDPSQVLR
jgi:hypothetical protein